MKHVALYCRLSPRPDGSYEGVDSQEKWGRKYAARAWPGVPVKVYPDSGLSAARDDVVRPKYDELREAIRGNQVGHLWTVEQSRLERREVGWFALAAELDAAGITELHTDRDGIVRVRDEVAGIKAVLAASEIRKLKRRVNDKLAENAAQGRPHGGRTFGYRRTVVDGAKVLEIVPEQAAVLRDAADKILSGWSLSNVAADLTKQGIRGANGAEISYGTLRRMLVNPTVNGQRVYRGRIVGRGNWPPIIDEPTWHALRAKLSAPRNVRTVDGKEYAIGTASYGQSTRSRRRYLLTGGLARAVCGAPMGAQRRKVYGQRLDAIYFCSGDYCVAAMADALEDHVRDVLLDELDKPEFLAAVAADDQDARRAQIYKALDALGRKRGNLAAMWTENELTDIEWRAARDGLQAQEQELQRELDEIPPPMGNLDIGEIRGAWPDMTLDERREITAMFIEKVVIDKAVPGAKAFSGDRVRIEWRAR